MTVPPIRIIEREGYLISIDNRRLLAFRIADVEIPTLQATPADIAEAVRQGKFSAGLIGADTIRIRAE